MATADEIRRAREATSIFSGLFDYIRANEERLAQEGRRSVLGGLFSKEPVYGTATNRYEGVLPLLASLAEPLARAIDAPRAAYEDLIPREDMLNEAFGTAGAAMMGGGLLKPSVKAGDLEVPPAMSVKNTPAGLLDANTLRVYHGGPQKLSASEVEMRPDPEGLPIGFSVTDNPDVAEYYRNMRGGGSISEFDIDLDKANIISESELYQFIDDLENRLDADASYEQIQQGLLDAGIDAIKYPDPEFGIRVVNPNILSANRSKLLGAGVLTTKEELDPQRLSKVKLPSYVADIDYVATPTGDLAAKNIVDIADLQGTTLIPAFGDRTYGGAKLEEISGVKLDQPVDMQGGHDFMRDLRTGLWASEENAMGPKAKFIDELIDAGEDPRMIYTAMGGQSADFSHHMADATMGLIEQSKISKKAAKEYDDIVREKLDPNWVGILSPKARDYLHNNMTGTLRRELWQEMDKGKWQKMGFPHLGVARASITDPELLTVEPFSSGLSIGKPFGGGLLDLQNKMPHKSYDAQIGGEYIGGLLDQVRGDMIFRDFFNARRAANIPTAGDQRSFMMSPYTKQVVDQQMVDEVSQYLESLRGRR